MKCIVELCRFSSILSGWPIIFDPLSFKITIRSLIIIVSREFSISIALFEQVLEVFGLPFDHFFGYTASFTEFRLAS